MTSTSEKDLLNFAISELESEGFEVVLEPRRSQLPDGIGSYLPDAIALGVPKNLFIEVTSETRKERTVDRDFREFLRKNPGWDRRVFHYRSTNRTVRKVDEPELLNEYFRFRSLADDGHELPALLVGWACMEATARIRSPNSFARAQTPGRIVSILAESGDITPSDADALRRLIQIRNAYVHGDFLQSIERRELEPLDRVLRSFHPRIKVDGIGNER